MTLSLSLLCACLLAQVGDLQQGAASGALWPLSGAAEHAGVPGGGRRQGPDGAAAGYYGLKLRKPRTPAREGVGGAQRLRPGECNPLASTWMRDLPSRLPGLELRRRPGLMLSQPTVRAPQNLHGDPLRSKTLQAPGSTQTAARPARARSSTSHAPPWPRPLHPHHTQVTPSTSRAPPQPRPPRPRLLQTWAPPPPPHTRPGRPHPYSTWTPRKRMAQRTKHPCAMDRTHLSGCKGRVSVFWELLSTCQQGTTFTP